MISRGQALEAMTGERFNVAVIGGGISALEEFPDLLQAEAEAEGLVVAQ